MYFHLFFKKEYINKVIYENNCNFLILLKKFRPKKILLKKQMKIILQTQ